ncbi:MULTISPECIES: aconitate hydratase AcnA [Pseudomonas]|jgi:aconitate hydratase|uniref:Aconitate hydratase n=1 Tax=Pseudomonas rhizophila TaxID=2045200 RepID=A0ABM6UJS2_9PSED|nr:MULTISPECIES: aconitate hydratase AcnA [Pseudomonas]AVU77758.1 aconitate hydratase AcnA [Pseudomonas rhizophila]MDD2030893.1 aconitate hydratase AcnA [Pseudomonas sp. 39167]MDR8389290.1 aconitate hydratase AcnA [Pseudomonas sp. JL2]MEA1031942.1 aconitate hydratase AcnA [Pseudomonas sp. N-137]MXR29808.1 aconitate hydratase AcnA [Pseudomonas sp. PICF6]
MPSLDSLKTLKTLQVDARIYHYFSLPDAARSLGDLDRLPMSLKVLLENLLRWEDEKTVTGTDLKALAGWLKERRSDREIQYRPARVLMQDFTGVPAVVDLAAMRAAMEKAGGDPQRINPLSPVDLVIDHSVMVDNFASSQAFEQNVDIEMQRNGERYAFLRWGQSAFDNFSVVPPGTGICHQVNLEYLGRTVWTKEEDGRTYAFPDTLVGTDSHTTMINGLGVLGWGVGGIEAEAAMLGQPVSMLIPEVIGFKLIGKLREGITATDLVLTVTQMLRKKGVVGKFVEFYGDGLADLPLADRATIANMAPEYGATCGFFPVDDVTLDYLRLSGRPTETVKLVEAYCKAQGLWRLPGQEPVFTDTLELDMGSVEASLAGPKRPQDRVSLPNVGQAFSDFLGLNVKPTSKEEGRLESEGGGGVAVGNADQVGESEYEFEGRTHRLKNGAVVIAAITSCTNTSNPSVMMAAGLLAKKAVEKGLTRKPWVKSSLAPGSKVVTDYYKAAGLTEYLDKLGFDLVGYGCTTCIGNSGPLPEPIEKAIQSADLTVASVLSGNRNFEGRVHPLVKTNWLASPPLVVAYALAGTVRIDISSEPLGNDRDGNPVYLRDIWPSSQEVANAVAQVNTSMFHKEYAAVFAGDEQWQAIEVPQAATYVWQSDSTYIQHPPFFENISGPPPAINNVEGARILALLGDSVTTDHISPAGNIKTDSPAGRYLREQGVEPRDFNSYGSRRGNHQVMMRGTFANIRIRNEMLGGEEGGNTIYIPSGEKMPIYDAAMSYQAMGTPLVVIAGQEYGTGSSRDWAAKGTNLLGVKAVIAESFERIHRSNLVGMGVLPLQFKLDQNRKSLNLTGKETLDILGLSDVELTPRMNLPLIITREDGRQERIEVLCRIDTLNEVEYFKAGGILHYVLRQLISE